MGDKLIMSRKELKRKVILEEVKKGLLSLKEATLRLGISYRQAKRIKKRYREKGDKGLIHQNRGKRSSRSYPQIFKEKVIEIYKEKYLGFGPTFATEKFAEEEGVKINAETLRLWLLDGHLWLRHRRRKSGKGESGGNISGSYCKLTDRITHGLEQKNRVAVY